MKKERKIQAYGRKKTQKTPQNELEKAIRLKNEYYEQKRDC